LIKSQLLYRLSYGLLAAWRPWCAPPSGAAYRAARGGTTSRGRVLRRWPRRRPIASPFAPAGASPVQRQEAGRSRPQHAKGKTQRPLGRAVGGGDAGGNRRDAAKGERQSESPIYLPGAGVGNESNDRTGTDKGQRQALGLDLPHPEERGQHR